MTAIETIEAPVIQPTIEIDEATKVELLSMVKEESQVIVHCKYKGESDYDQIRIWKSTFLYPNGSAEVSELVHHENIALYPDWSVVEMNQTLNFTLIFTGLPKDCVVFDLIEKIPEPGGFEVKNIPRNNSDVYYIEFNE